MRKLAWAALPYAASVFAAEYFLPVKGLPFIAAALFLLGWAGLFFHGKVRRRVMIFLFSAAVGFGWYAGHYALTSAPCLAMEKQRVAVCARVTDYPCVTDDYSRVEVRLQGDGLPHVLADLYLYDAELPELRPGDLIETEIYISEEADRYAYKDKYLCGYICDELCVTGRSGLAWLSFPKTLCKALKDSCDCVFPESAAPLIKGMMTGDTDDLRSDQKNYSAIRSCGVSHIIAVSGLHMMYLVAFVQLLSGGRSRKASLICLPIIFIFVLMTGCTPSVVRAAVIQSAFLLAPIFRRENDYLTALSAALLLLLLANPNAVASLSLQLSFCAAFGLLIFCPPLRRLSDKYVRNKLLSYVADSFICTVGATAFSVPVAAYYFGSIPLLSAFVNLLALPVLEVVFCAGYALSVAGLLLPGVMSVLAWLPAAAVWICEAFFRLVAGLPFVCAYTDNRWVIAWLVFLYGSFLATFILRRRHKRVRYIIPAALSLAMLCIVMGAADLSAGSDAGISVLDVGQGQCVCLYDDDATVVVDCGGNRDRENAGDIAANNLYANGRDRVELLILTHLHSDHTNGVTELLYRIPVERLAFSEECFDDDLILNEVLAAAQDCGTDILLIDRETGITVGDMELSLYLPLRGEDENERGIVVAAKIHDRDILINGDIDQEGELALVSEGRADTDILVVGHHGSKYSSSSLFLNVASPEVSIISVGDNPYGHPTEQALDRLYTYSDEVRRTDLDGNVTIRID